MKKGNEKKCNIKEIVSFYIIFMLFSFYLGNIFGYTFYKIEGININNYISSSVLDFFLNNLIYFILISVLPVINFLMCIVQLFSLGISNFLIQSFDFNFRFLTLYRHAVFEVASLLLSVSVSFEWLNIIKKYLSNIQLKQKDLKRILFKYVIIFILTLIGAILEGTAYV